MGMVMGKHASPLLVAVTVAAVAIAVSVSPLSEWWDGPGGEDVVVAGPEEPLPTMASGAAAEAPVLEEPELHPLSTAIRQTNWTDDH